MLPLFGFLVALFLAIIGYLQWCIAYQRIILDLFQRRFQTYDELRSVIFAKKFRFSLSPREIAKFFIGLCLEDYRRFQQPNTKSSKKKFTKPTSGW